jgi:phospholipid-translocating ATPase
LKYLFIKKKNISQISPLRAENILLRGATLKISPFIYGCAIYTGKDTKIMLNSKYKPSKLSCIER